MFWGTVWINRSLFQGRREHNLFTGGSWFLLIAILPWHFIKSPLFPVCAYKDAKQITLGPHTTVTKEGVLRQEGKHAQCGHKVESCSKTTRVHVAQITATWIRMRISEEASRIWTQDFIHAHDLNHLLHAGESQVSQTQLPSWEPSCAYKCLTSIRGCRSCKFLKLNMYQAEFNLIFPKPTLPDVLSLSKESQHSFSHSTKIEVLILPWILSTLLLT